MNEDELNELLLTWIKGHFFGKYRGTVSDNADPTNRGRLKVKVQRFSERSKRGPCRVCRTPEKKLVSIVCLNRESVSGLSSKPAILAIQFGQVVFGEITSCRIREGLRSRFGRLKS